MGNGRLDMFIVGDGQTLGARLVGLYSNLEIDVVFSGSERHPFLVTIIKLKGYLIPASLHILSQEHQVWCNWRRSNEEIEEGFIEAEILELALAVADGYRLADADLALITFKNIIVLC